MAAGDYSATQMLDVFEELGRNDLGEEFSEFQNRAKGNLETLRMFSDNSPLCYPNEAMRNAFNKKTSPDQDVFVDVNQNVVAGVGAQSVRIGSGGANRVQVQISGQTPIEEGFEISRMNEAMSRFNSYSIETRAKYSMMFNMGHVMQNIMARAEKQAQAFIDANKWAAGGVGTIFTATGDYKTIPAGQDDEVFWKISTETLENKLNLNQGKVNILGSNYVPYMIGTTKGYGQNNSKDLSGSLEQFDTYIASELAPIAPVTDQALLYTVAKGGVGMISHAHKHSEGTYDNGQDYWMTAALSSMPMFDGINTDLVELQVKGYRGWQDSFATYANDPSRIDIIEAISVVANFYLFRSYSPTARRPIVAYTKLK